MKTFIFHWKDGSTEEIKGNTVADAFNTRYSSGALGALDYYETQKYEPGQPCDHPGCLAHQSHPCEGCGRIGGQQ